MYVVRRAFRNFGQMMTPGSIVEPGAIKRFKSRLNDRHIVEVHEQDFEKWQRYFKDRVGVELKHPEPEKTPGSDGTPEPEKTPGSESAPEPVKAPIPKTAVTGVVKVAKPVAAVVGKAN